MNFCRWLRSVLVEYKLQIRKQEILRFPFLSGYETGKKDKIQAWILSFIPILYPEKNENRKVPVL